MRFSKRFVACQAASDNGFTLIESLVVVIMVGVLAAIAAPGWLRFLEVRRLTAAQEKTYLAIRQAQSQAQRTGRNWQFSIREGISGTVEWAVHPQGSTPTSWEPVTGDSIAIDTADTTLNAVAGEYYIRFDYKGNLVSQTRTLTLTSEADPSLKRCIVASTLLGTLRQAKEQPVPNGAGRYCY
jgi:prepilin-type N-terminal cleavage/methylation domain-containing protein